MLIQLTDSKALKLLHELEELHLIKVLNENVLPAKKSLSDKYRGIISKKSGEDLQKHIKKMRGEWKNI